MPRLDRDSATDGAVSPPASPVLSTRTFSPQTEPVRLAFAVQSLIAAAISVSTVFGWIDWTETQVAAVMTLYAAILPVIGALVRSKVVPVARVEAERQKP